MKRLILVMIVFLLSVNQVHTDNTLQLRQFIGGNALCGWYHNEQYLGTEVIYNNKPWLLMGTGPRHTFTQGKNELKLFGYFALTSNVAKKQWPIEKAELDSFIAPKSGTWSVLFRTRVGLEIANGNTPVYWGEDFVGYQITKSLQIQIRTEWICKDHALNQSVGFGWANKVSTMMNFIGYVGAATKKPYAKTGWIELRMARQ